MPREQRSAKIVEPIPEGGLSLASLLDFVLEAEAAGADMNQEITFKMGYVSGRGYCLVGLEADISPY